MSSDNVAALIKAIQSSGGITLQNEAQLTVAFQKAGDKTMEQVFLETGIFTPKQVTGLCKTVDLMDQNRITPLEIATCMATMLGTFSTLDEALKEIEVMARPEGQVAEPDPVYAAPEPQFASGEYQRQYEAAQQYESGQYQQQQDAQPQFQQQQEQQYQQQQPQYESPPQYQQTQSSEGAPPVPGVPTVIHLLVNARVISQDALNNFMQHLNAAPHIPWQQHAMTLGLLDAESLEAAAMGQQMIDAGQINEAQFSVCMYDQIGKMCTFRDSLQARGWLPQG